MAGILDLFVPKEKKFFTYLHQQIMLLEKGSHILNSHVKAKELNSQKLQKQTAKIKKLCEETDLLSREITASLHNTFITPIDREDIQLLSVTISYSMRSIKKIGDSISYLKIEKYDKRFLNQVRILEQSIALLTLIFEEPLSLKRNKSTLEKVRDFEREGDDVFGEALSALFARSKSTIEIVKMKELYEVSEKAIDDVRAIADILETVIITNS